MPDRRGPMRKAPCRFVERVNDGTISDGAVVIYGGDIGLDDINLPMFDEQPTVSGDAVSLLAPAGARGGKLVNLEDLMMMMPVFHSVTGGNYYNIVGEHVIFSGEELFPSKHWEPGSESTPSSQWLPGSPADPDTNWMPDDPQDLRVLFASTERSAEDVFGVPAEEMDGQPLEEGESVPAANTVLINSPSELFTDASPQAANDSPIWDWIELFNAGRPAPLAGATLGMSVLSTPDASVAGQSSNPLVNVATEDLLQRTEAQKILKNAGVTDANNMEWLAGPKAADGPDGTTDEEGYDQPTLLGEETDIESFSGVVSGEEHPWGVAAHVARATPDDHVVAAAVQRWPVGTGNAPLFMPEEGIPWIVDAFSRLTVE